MLRKYRPVAVILLAIALAACGMTEPRTITPGVADTGKLRVTLGEGWYRGPSSETSEKRGTTRIYTREGIETDRLYLIGGIDDGKTIFKEDSAGGAAPFSVSMSSTDIGELIADSLEAVLWGGAAEITTVNLNERGFTGIPGIQFELEASGPVNHRGVAGAFVAEDRLYAVVFLAESPDAFERNQERVLEIIDSAIFSIKTIRR